MLDQSTLSTAAQEIHQEARAQVALFDSTASATARKLARLLAAVPLSLPVMQLVRNVFAPEAEQVHLAEVFLSGLLKEARAEEETGRASDVNYEFLHGIAEVLLESVPTPDAVAVLSEYVENRLGHAIDFPAMLESPAKVDAEQVGAAHRSFARVAARVLKRFGGTYAELAERLERSDAKSTLPVSSVESQGKTTSTGVPAEKPVEMSSEASHWQFGGKWVLVVGTGGETLSAELREFARDIGIALAKTGYGLLGGGWLGVDHEVGMAYVTELRARGGDDSTYFVQIIETGSTPPLASVGKLEPVPRSGIFSLRLSRADAIILLGGHGGTLQIYLNAAAGNMPVCPLPMTGGDAFKAYTAMSSNFRYLWRINVSKRRLQQLHTHLSEPAANAAIHFVSHCLEPRAVKPYAEAMLDVIQAIDQTLLAEGGRTGKPQWNKILGVLTGAAEMKRIEPRPLAPKLSLRPGETASVEIPLFLNDPGPALRRLRTTLPANLDRLMVDFEQMGMVEDYFSTGAHIQSAVASLIIEFTNDDPLDVAAELLRAASPTDRALIVLISIVDAILPRFSTLENYEAWLLEYTGLSRPTHLFTREMLRLAQACARVYGVTREWSLERSDLAMQQALKSSPMAPNSDNWALAGEFWNTNVADTLGADSSPRVNAHEGDLFDVLSGRATKTLPQFSDVSPRANVEALLRHARGESAVVRGVVYLLIQEHQLVMLANRLTHDLAYETELLTSKRADSLIAVQRLLCCINRFKDEAELQNAWSQLQNQFIRLTQVLRNTGEPEQEKTLRELLRYLASHDPVRGDQSH